MTLMLFLGAWGVIYEKKLEAKKSPETVPLKVLTLLTLVNMFSLIMAYLKSNWFLAADFFFVSITSFLLQLA
jgi:hypothetical protein